MASAFVFVSRFRKERAVGRDLSARWFTGVRVLRRTAGENNLNKYRTTGKKRDLLVYTPLFDLCLFLEPSETILCSEIC